MTRDAYRHSLAQLNQLAVSAGVTWSLAFEQTAAYGLACDVRAFVGSEQVQSRASVMPYRGDSHRITKLRAERRAKRLALISLGLL